MKSLFYFRRIKWELFDDGSHGLTILFYAMIHNNCFSRFRFLCTHFSNLSAFDHMLLQVFIILSVSGSSPCQGSFIWWSSFNRFMILIAITKTLVLHSLQQNILLSEIAYPMPNLTCCYLPGTLLLNGESKNSISFCSLVSTHEVHILCTGFSMALLFFLDLYLNHLALFVFKFHVYIYSILVVLELWFQNLFFFFFYIAYKRTLTHVPSPLFGVPNQLSYSLWSWFQNFSLLSSFFFF